MNFIPKNSKYSEFEQNLQNANVVLQLHEHSNIAYIQQAKSYRKDLKENAK